MSAIDSEDPKATGYSKVEEGLLRLEWLRDYAGLLARPVRPSNRMKAWRSEEQVHHR